MKLIELEKIKLPPPLPQTGEGVKKYLLDNRSSLYITTVGLDTTLYAYQGEVDKFVEGDIRV